MKCKDIMTSNPSYCSPEEISVKAARIMRDEDVGIVPVCEEGKKLVGVVTDRDICLTVVAEERHPREVKVLECMSEDLVTCKPEDDVQKAADLMKEYQVRRIPVVDDQGRILGMIAQADIALKVGKPEEVTETVQEISKPSKAA
ncbi:MAG: CBS domain-containing protein [Candidatus Manganitrophus sp.]|nr:CBS domain-containing protein [Candidatus Manganitrophus sp.]MDC4225457.1 CBS domain-containing protein [Candidatus Manganitrophus sp.]WDT73174.1 MAG: CBS domain-containing protein [Candidatus Manganitrophus sp.]WDT74623.1 MAG: CBS domain-containing protein [Candidatus Manganitrophus sp.]WDT79285.1 MAG: CBS domain-containing protein [Candidatus Manganitrophus sp.]